MAKILLADDDAQIRELVAYVLKKEGHEILTADNGEEAIAKAESEKPDLLVMDVVMPVMDGFSAVARMAGDPDLKGIPVLILTSKVGLEDAFTAQPNVAGYLKKPFQGPDLREAVRSALARKQQGA